MELKGKKAIVTGASGGMGVEICKRLAEAGVDLAVCSNDGQKLNELVQKIGSGIRVISQTLDVTDENEVKKFYETVSSEFGKVNLLFNLAGLSVPAQIENMNESDYDMIMDVNIKGAFLVSKHFVPIAAENALVINIGSMAAKRANPNAPVYCAAKAAVNMLSQGMAMQFAEKKIRVTTLNPGGTDTAFWGDRSVDRSKLLTASDVADVAMAVVGFGDRVQVQCVDFEAFN